MHAPFVAHSAALTLNRQVNVRMKAVVHKIRLPVSTSARIQCPPLVRSSVHCCVLRRWCAHLFTAVSRTSAPAQVNKHVHWTSNTWAYEGQAPSERACESGCTSDKRVLACTSWRLFAHLRTAVFGAAVRASICPGPRTRRRKQCNPQLDVRPIAIDFLMRVPVRTFARFARSL